MSNFLAEDALSILVLKMQERSPGIQPDCGQCNDDSDDSLADSQPCRPKASETKCEPAWSASDSLPCSSSSFRNRSPPHSILKVAFDNNCEKVLAPKCGECKAKEEPATDADYDGCDNGAGGAGGMLSTSAIKWGIGLMKEGLQSFICPTVGGEDNTHDDTSSDSTHTRAAIKQDPDAWMSGLVRAQSPCPQSLPLPTPPPAQHGLSKRTSNMHHSQATAGYQQQCRPMQMSQYSANESSLSNCSAGAVAAAKCHTARSSNQSFYADSDYETDNKQRLPCLGSTRRTTRKCDYDLADANAGYGLNETKYGGGKPAYRLSDAGYASCNGVSDAETLNSMKAANACGSAVKACTSNLSPTHSNMSRSSHNPYGSQRSYGSSTMQSEYDDRRAGYGAPRERPLVGNGCNEAKLRPRSRSCGAPPESVYSMRSCGSQNSYNARRNAIYPDDYENTMPYNAARDLSSTRGSMSRNFDPQLASTMRMRSDCSRVSFPRSSGSNCSNGQQQQQHGYAGTTRLQHRPRPVDPKQCEMALAMAQALQAQAMSRGARCQNEMAGRSSQAASPCHSQYQSPCPAAAPAPCPALTKPQCPKVSDTQPCSSMLDNNVLKRLQQLQVDHLVRDQYFPGTIQSTINGIEDFEQLAASVVALQAKGAAKSQCPNIEPISLLEAFEMRIELERNVVMDELEAAPETCGNAEPTVRSIEDHYCKRFHTELNEAIASLFKAEIQNDQFETDADTQKPPTFAMQMEKKTELEMPMDPCAAPTSATTSNESNNTAALCTVYMGMTMPNDVDECADVDDAPEKVDEPELDEVEGEQQGKSSKAKDKM